MKAIMSVGDMGLSCTVVLQSHKHKNMHFWALLKNGQAFIDRG